MSDQQQQTMIAVAAALDRMAAAMEGVVLAMSGHGATGGASAAKAPAKKRQDAAVTVSDELAAFVGIDAGEATTRQAASALVMKYVKENSLQDKDDRRRILPDAALAQLLGADGVVSVLNLKSALKDHFSALST